MDPDAKLKDLGITLPNPQKPFASYRSAVQSGKLLFIAGQGPTREGKILMQGKLGEKYGVKEGQEASFTVNAHAGRVFPSRVVAVRSEPTGAQGVVRYEAILSVDNGDRRLLPGMTASATVVTENRQAVLLVANAALRFAPALDAGVRSRGSSDVGSRRVFVLEGDTPREVPVEVGISDGRTTEIVRGDLRGGAKVILDDADPE